MPRWMPIGVVVLATALPCRAAQPPEKPILETWDASYLEGSRAGFVRTATYELDQGGKKFLRTIVEMQLSVKKFKQVIQLRGQVGNDEAPDGTVLSTFMRQGIGQKKDLTIVGIVKGKQLELLIDGKSGVLQPAPWDDRAVGLYRQQSLLADRKVKPGDKFNFLSFEPTVNLLVRMDVTVKDFEEVSVPGAKSRSKLLRVELVPEKLEGVELPKLTQWLDEDLKLVRQDTEIPGLGQMTLVRTTREVALAPGAEATLTDIGISQLIRLNRTVSKPYETRSAVYRITIKGDDDAATAFVQDDRQKVINSKGSTFDLQVTATKAPQKTVSGGKVADEFLQSCYFITSDDAKVKELARRAVGKETTPLKKALLIEKWVHTNMRSTGAEALSPASEVARNLEGDCTEYAMLMAAMCRAEGVPSKTAIGLIYADTKSGPAMAFHMWTEVWVGGQWLPLDATLGKGYVGATHLKVTDHSWHDTRALTPLLPLIRVLGKMQVEIVSAQ